MCSIWPIFLTCRTVPPIIEMRTVGLTWRPVPACHQGARRHAGPDEGPVGGIVASRHKAAPPPALRSSATMLVVPAHSHCARTRPTQWGTVDPQKGLNDESMTAGRLAPEEPCIAVSGCDRVLACPPWFLHWSAPDVLTRRINKRYQRQVLQRGYPRICYTSSWICNSFHPLRG